LVIGSKTKESANTDWPANIVIATVKRQKQGRTFQLIAAGISDTQAIHSRFQLDE
jgi:hypothetical protein